MPGRCMRCVLRCVPCLTSLIDLLFFFSFKVVDTVLAKLYTESGETTDLLALIGGPNDIVLREVEPLLVSANRYDALCRLYRSRGEDRKLLEMWSK